jgi:hypothetical protein
MYTRYYVSHNVQNNRFDENDHDASAEHDCKMSLRQTLTIRQKKVIENVLLKTVFYFVICMTQHGKLVIITIFDNNKPYTEQQFIN